MGLLVFIAAVAVSIILQRQAAKHRREISLESERLGIAIPHRRPKIRALEALLNIDIGCILAGFGAMQIWIMIAVLPPSFTEGAGMHEMSFNLWGLASLTFSGGLALLFLGARALVEIIRYARMRGARA